MGFRRKAKLDLFYILVATNSKIPHEGAIIVFGRVCCIDAFFTKTRSSYKASECYTQHQHTGAFLPSRATSRRRVFSDIKKEKNYHGWRLEQQRFFVVTTASTITIMDTYGTIACLGLLCTDAAVSWQATSARSFATTAE